MHYALLFAEPPEELARRDGPEPPAYWGAWTAYMGALQQAGVMRGGNALLPSATAATLRLCGGERPVQDGPYADSKEQLGGFVVIEVPDMAAALDWAARCPGATDGSVEARPVLPPPPK